MCQLRVFHEQCWAKSGGELSTLLWQAVQMGWSSSGKVEFGCYYNLNGSMNCQIKLLSIFIVDSLEILGNLFRFYLCKSAWTYVVLKLGGRAAN